MKNGANYASQDDPARNPQFSRRWSEPLDSESLQSGDSPAAKVVANLQFRQQVERLHALGPRATAELLAEIGTERSFMPTIAEKLRRYASIDPQALQALGGDDFWPAPLHEVRRAS
jgi:hypothetical protein